MHFLCFDTHLSQISVSAGWGNNLIHLFEPISEFFDMFNIWECSTDKVWYLNILHIWNLVWHQWSAIHGIYVRWETRRPAKFNISTYICCLRPKFKLCLLILLFFCLLGLLIIESIYIFTWASYILLYNLRGNIYEMQISWLKRGKHFYYYWIKTFLNELYLCLIGFVNISLLIMLSRSQNDTPDQIFCQDVNLSEELNRGVDTGSNIVHLERFRNN